MTTPDAQSRTTSPEPGSGAPTPRPAAPIALVLAITFLGSTGTAIITSGLSFIAQEALQYDARRNLILALAMGAVYTPASYLSGRVLRRLVRRSPNLTSRRFLSAILLTLLLICQLPLIAAKIDPGLREPALWLCALVFMIGTGLQWPVVEAYLSGGRRGTKLRKAVGKFNLAWSSAMVVSFWFMAPLLEHSALLIIAILGWIHIPMLIAAAKLSAEPAKEIHEDEPHPESYERLLKVFQTLIVASYIVIATMIPLLPSIESRLGIEVHWLTPIASTWLISRVAVFALMERWHGWHGRWWTPWFGFAVMTSGFAFALLAPSAPEPIGIAALIGALILVGIGIAVIYCGSLYYALAVGGAEVDSGGTHEALIGAGYTIGPACGLIAGSITGWEDDASDRAVILIVCVVVAGILWRAALVARAARDTRL